MDELLTKLQEFFERLIKLFTLLQRLLATIKQHPGTTAGIILTLLFYLGLYWYAFEYPARTIHSFYASIDASPRRTLDAWNLLHPPYHQRWSNNQQTFASGFKTTQFHKGLVVERTEHSFNPTRLLIALLSQSAEYDVAFIAIDRFTKTDCQQKEQEDDCRWLQISDPARYKLLMDGTLAAREASSEPSLELKRYYKKKFTLYRTSASSWLISGIDPLEVGLIQ